MLDDQLLARLTATAQRARDNAYAPYSRFRVGAALLAGGTIYAGGNIENASYGLTICAERVAVFNAVAAGERSLDAIVVVSEAASPTPPCGACRQVLHEFGPAMSVLLLGARETVTLPLSHLLPHAFGPTDLAH